MLIRYFLITGSGAFSFPFIYSTQLEVTFLSAGDVNKDKQLDIIVGHGPSRQISVHFEFINQTIFSISFTPNDAKQVDINGDGKMEIIVIGTALSNEYIGILWIYC